MAASLENQFIMKENFKSMNENIQHHDYGDDKEENQEKFPVIIFP